jgi:hypothetical protein
MHIFGQVVIDLVTRPGLLIVGKFQSCNGYIKQDKNTAVYIKQDKNTAI